MASSASKTRRAIALFSGSRMAAVYKSLQLLCVAESRGVVSQLAAMLPVDVAEGCTAPFEIIGSPNRIFTLSGRVLNGTCQNLQVGRDVAGCELPAGRGFLVIVRSCL